MAILSPYENDIYISYRHNDTILEWVEEFVNKLKQELEATIKDDLSIYYAKQVKGNLPEEEFEAERIQNLKSLIFIPIVSLTYCDTNNYCWKDEFLEFKNMASGDDIGLNIELSNGSLISRILPIKIHNIDPQDVNLLETELSGNMRSVSFIYDDLEGVNRPLRAQDDSMDHTENKVLFRNQINKTANAIAEIIRNIKSQHSDLTSAPKTEQVTEKSNVKEQKTVFLSWSAKDVTARRDELLLIMQKAGMNVIPLTDCPSDDEALKNRVAEAIKHAHCSVHLLGSEVGRKFLDNPTISIPYYQYSEANKKTNNGSNFTQFIWQCPMNDLTEIEQDQRNFINQIRNNITDKMVFTNVPTPMQLVDDIRSSFLVTTKKVLKTIETEVFFISNQLDDDETKEITDLLSDVVDIHSLVISQDKDLDYGELTVQQMKKSKLGVIYFREASDWALPFIQQIWKMAGGASSGTPLLLIGDDSLEANQVKQFNAPKVVSKIVAKDLIALEVKATYDKAIEGTIN